jgi:hypothetical protein
VRLEQRRNNLREELFVFVGEQARVFALVPERLLLLAGGRLLHIPDAGAAAAAAHHAPVLRWVLLGRV